MGDKDLTVKASTEIVPQFMQGVAGATGFEDVSADCIAIPIMRLAQTNTPQASPGKDRLDGLEAGQYFNPTTGRIYSDPSFIILGFFRSWTVWHGEPPNATFVRALTPDDFGADYEGKTHRDEKSGKVVDDDDNRYVDTRNFLVLANQHPEDGILLYAMTSTGIPASKMWLAKAGSIRVKDPEGKLVQAPMWARVWELKAIYKQGAKGSYFKVSNITDRGWIDEKLAPMAKTMFEEAQSYNKLQIAAVVKDELPF